ncbi:LysR family transcriptional regulator [Geobacter sp. FeAm09]|uniref:LysR family transcriptional regulator n=1 Tax=Geobacter sp. FeAm09 TaxID=2597769 RepID=UPI0011EFF4A0|nr:LysR family transcriptional regulator [Geobacter sp. FeAm09]QEM69324.1 LysR family transcriptional regulator [Geobacter sp. FeAm09]
MNNLPPLEDLRLLCAVVRNRSFVATATELGVSPAYVSKRIALLEDVLHVRLLHRTTRRVSVSEDGELVYRWAQRIIEDVEQMAESVTTAKTTPRGLLRISASAGFGRKRIAPALSELVELYPQLRIQLELLARPVDLIGEGFDIDIRIGGTSEPNLIARRIAANSRILCAAPAYLERRGVPARVSDLERHDCLVIRERDQSFGVWRLKGPHGVETVHVSGPLSCNNGEITRQWALDGHGIMLRSTWDVASRVREGLLVRVLPDYQQEAHIAAVYPLRLTESAKVRVCVEFLQQWLGR